MAVSRRALATGRAIFAALAASVLLRRPAHAQPVPQGTMLTLAFSDLASLRAYDVRQLPANTHVIARVAGYTHPGDGGGGVFDWLPASEAFDDPGVPAMPPIVHVPSTVAGRTQGRWVRQMTVPVYTPEMAGAIGDGRTDDSGAFDRLRHLLAIQGGGTIRLTPGKYYRIGSGNVFVPTRTVLEGGDSAFGQTAPNGNSLLSHGGLLLDPRRTVVLDYFAELRNVAVLRDGLAIAGPTSAEELHRTIDVWGKESGTAEVNGGARSVGITLGGHGVRVSNCLVVGFHTALYSKGYARFLIESLNFDCANGLEITECSDTSRIRDCHANQFWSSNIGNNQSVYRPGIGYNLHDHCDGLVVEDSYADGFQIGWRLSNVWSVTLRTPQVEGFSPDGGKTPVYGFLFENIVVQTRIYDAYADMGAGGTGLYLMHTDKTHAPAPLQEGIPMSDVTFIGGSIGSSVADRPLIVCGPASRGQFIGATFEGGGPNAIVLQPGIGAWRFIAPLFGVFTRLPWLQVMDPADWSRVYIAASQVWSPPEPAAASYVQTHVNETTWIATDGALAKHDGTPSAPLTVHNTASGAARNPNIVLARGGAPDRPAIVGSIQTDATATYYNTNSDYRLKTIHGALQDPWEQIERLRVYLGYFNADPAVSLPMLLAHEVQQIAPYAVTGAKDAVDDAGQPRYQQIDPGKLVPLLVAAMVSQHRINQELSAGVATLEKTLADRQASQGAAI